jgi:antitoxin HigA-1
LRLARFFGNSARFWINLQSQYDLKKAEREIAAEIKRDVPVLKRAS